MLGIQVTDQTATKGYFQSGSFDRSLCRRAAHTEKEFDPKGSTAGGRFMVGRANKGILSIQA